MTDQQWADLMTQTYNDARQALLDEGYTVITEKPFLIYEKDGQRLYLSRQFGDSEWFRQYDVPEFSLTP